MQMETIQGSSTIAAVGYDPDAQRLRVVFHGGSGYDYHAVPAQVHADFMAAESKGKFLAAVIKPRYAFSKLGAAPKGG